MTHTDRTFDALDAGSGGGLDRWLRTRVLSRLDSIEQGSLAIEDVDGEYTLGNPDDALKATVVIRDLRFWRLMASGGSVGAAEAWMAQLWDSPDPVAVVQVLARNRRVLDEMETAAARLANGALGLWHAFNRNSLKGSRRNIAAHYDLGNDFFAAWLDERMMYSSALYLEDGETLEQAQLNKLERICRKLALGPEDHLLEIGTGWGGLAIHAAEHYGCRVTTTTISREQYDLAREKVHKAGLEDRITLLTNDYRMLEGQFDKIVSVEMIEAVGHQYLDTYLAKIDELLRPDGLALIQAITIEDYRYASALKGVDFIKCYIFPGAFIPSVSTITQSMARASRLGLVELADFGTSYARTLAAWRERFEVRWEAIREMGFDEAFRRRWLWYLAYCEGGFRERAISDVHLLLAGPQWRPASEAGLTAGSELLA
ncbi:MULTISPECIES: cyclopropane-fatty-acyl-phospholipid synthase family protein [unclassified Wenzhouxiangella]|uniref:SAM-dependent methyltransferase n=1 Tax=unclassified Wenzhouxiangella TaxID=2613841 RepID=UPI000E326630|nr:MULTISPECIES: cyclopropane-fatty-acyl-phospholipid synthase family protein [unclassified Wenzhouxiangella]RFF28777.1 class I SAM-dependent methyltransferase [Wenzhouxiangella sp. 15181]RFP67819.1 class I SAM-dependent methyltransferase [Wenzhouxiangella sp. 15190]